MDFDKLIAMGRMQFRKHHANSVEIRNDRKETFKHHLEKAGCFSLVVLIMTMANGKDLVYPEVFQ